MSRVEENRDLVNHFAIKAMKNPSGTYEEMIVWNLGSINSFLADISKSLAVIADKINLQESEDKK